MKKVGPFVENFGEATTACLITMVQGNLLVLGLTHWAIASQTGLIAATLASVALFLAQTDNRLTIAIVLGAVTAFVDYFVHPGMFGPQFLEAFVTGCGAAVLSYSAGTIVKRWRERRAASQGVS